VTSSVITTHVIVLLIIFIPSLRSVKAETLDFDEEAHSLFKLLNLDPATSGSTSRFNHVDAVYRDPKTNATVYVGNQSAAQELALLQKYNISSVVNCTDNMPNYHEKIVRSSSKMSSTSSIDYLRFPISFWSRSLSSSSPLSEGQQM
jgi:hypothetical protein